MNAYQLLAEVAHDRGMSVDDLTTKDRGSRSLSRAAARAEAAWQLRFYGYSYPEIGRLLGNRDHTTAIHLVRRYSARGQEITQIGRLGSKRRETANVTSDVHVETSR